MKRENIAQIRIGNWFTHDSEWSYRNEKLEFFDFQWEDRDWYALGECTLDLESILPIPLTKDRLLKCGFENTENNLFVQKEYINNSKMRIIWSEKHGFQWLPNIWVAINLPYIHTLQNLFFVLNNQDLIFQND